MGNNATSLVLVDVSEAVKGALIQFFRSTDRKIPEINRDTDLMKGFGATSDEGVDFAIDLSEVLGVKVPDNFNPFVHDSGKRGMRFEELVERAKKFVSDAKENLHGK
jgi:hypothetical protein